MSMKRTSSINLSSDKKCIIVINGSWLEHERKKSHQLKYKHDVFTKKTFCEMEILHKRISIIRCDIIMPKMF